MPWPQMRARVRAVGGWRVPTEHHAHGAVLSSYVYVDSAPDKSLWFLASNSIPVFVDYSFSIADANELHSGHGPAPGRNRHHLIDVIGSLNHRGQRAGGDGARLL